MLFGGGGVVRNNNSVGGVALTKRRGLRGFREQQQVIGGAASQTGARENTFIVGRLISRRGPSIDGSSCIYRWAKK